MLRKSTNSGRRSAVITGVLLIAGMVAGIFSVVPVIDGADYIVKAFTNEYQVLIGAFFQLLMVVAYVGIPILMYPILSKHNKGLALGSAAFGIIAGVFIIIGVIILLLLLTLSHEFAKAGTLDVSYFQTLGGLLQAGRDLVNHVAITLTFVLAMLLFNFIFYQTKLVPRWLSVWGLIGSTLSILTSLLFMIRFIGLDGTYMMLNIPIAFQQLGLAIWLIVKGFNGAVQQDSVSN
jgi:MFS family permease